MGIVIGPVDRGARGFVLAAAEPCVPRTRTAPARVLFLGAEVVCSSLARRSSRSRCRTSIRDGRICAEVIGHLLAVWNRAAGAS